MVIGRTRVWFCRQTFYERRKKCAQPRNGGGGGARETVAFTTRTAAYAFRGRQTSCCGRGADAVCAIRGTSAHAAAVEHHAAGPPMGGADVGEERAAARAPAPRPPTPLWGTRTCAASVPPGSPLAARRTPSGAHHRPSTPLPATTPPPYPIRGFRPARVLF